MEERVTFGGRIRQLRIAAGLQQKDLAARVGMEVTYLSKVETGRLPPPSEGKIRALAEALQAGVDELLFLAHKLPDDIPDAIHESLKVPQFLRTARGLREEGWDELIKLAQRLQRERT